MPRFRRILAVTIGLAGTGAAIGALCGGVIACLAVLIAGQGEALFSRGGGTLLGICAAVGGVLGAVTAPAVVWGLLRRVPLGKAAVWGALGTVLGAVIGEWLRPFNLFTRNVPGVLIGGFIGFVAASVALRARSGRAVSPSSTERSNVR